MGYVLAWLEAGGTGDRQALGCVSCLQPHPSSHPKIPERTVLPIFYFYMSLWEFSLCGLHLNPASPSQKDLNMPLTSICCTTSISSVLQCFLPVDSTCSSMTNFYSDMLLFLLIVDVQ